MTSVERRRQQNTRPERYPTLAFHLPRSGCPPEPSRSRHAVHKPPYTRSSLVRWITRENPEMREWGNEGAGNEERPLSSRASADSERAKRVEESSSTGVEGSALGFRAENADNCQRTLRTAQAKESLRRTIKRIWDCGWRAAVRRRIERDSESGSPCSLVVVRVSARNSESDPARTPLARRTGIQTASERRRVLRPFPTHHSLTH
jgi:hypothetical protein